VLSLPVARAHHRELLEQSTQRSSKGCRHCSKSIDGDYLTISTSIENYWMVASLCASSSDWFIDYGCTTQISGHRSMFITYTENPLNTKKVKEYNGVTSFASGCGCVRLTCQVPDGKMETIVLQEVVHLPGSFNLISHSQTMDKDVKVEPVNQYCLNLYNPHGKLITTAPRVNGLFVLDRFPD